MKYILIDCMAIVHATFHAMKNDRLTHKGEPVEVIYGFFHTLLDLYNQFETTNFVFIWDSKRSKRKSLYFEEYKKKRADQRKELTDDEIEELQGMFDQANALRKVILPALGIKNSFMQCGYEGDDILGSICTDDRYYQDEFVMVTQDKDMYQLLTPKVSFWNKRKGLYTYSDFRKEYGIVPKQWIDVKAIGGCTSDAIPGVPGVAEKTVCKYLNHELKETSKKYEAIVSEYGRAVTNFNRVLVELPFPGTKQFKISSDEWNLKDLFKLFKQYGFKKFLNERDDEWEEFTEFSQALPY